MNNPRWRLCLILLCTTQFVALLDLGGMTLFICGLALLGASLAADAPWGGFDSSRHLVGGHWLWGRVSRLDGGRDRGR